MVFILIATLLVPIYPTDIYASNSIGTKFEITESEDMSNDNSIIEDYSSEKKGNDSSEKLLKQDEEVFISSELKESILDDSTSNDTNNIDDNVTDDMSD